LLEAPIPDVEEQPAAGESEPAAGLPAVRRIVKVLRMTAVATAEFVAIVLLFVYPGFLYHGSRPSVPPRQDSSPLALRVEHSGAELMLTWNRESDAVKNATRAVLSISDGAQHENVEMDLAQLRNGSIVYSPSSPDIVFRMEVTGADRTKTTSESLRVLRTRPSPMAEPAQQSHGPGAAPAKGPGTPDDAVAGPPVSAAGAADAASGEQPAAQTEVRPNTTPLKQFNTDSLSQRLRPPRSTDLPDAPEVGRGGEAVSAGVPVGVNAAPPPLLTPGSPQPTAGPQGASAQAANAARPPASGGHIQQAQLVSRKDPEYPPIAKQSGAQGEVVLTAIIGVDGKVKDVKAVQGHPLLRNAAVAAVKQWVYKPTLLNGVPVEAETKIVLNFVPRR